jgi:hypothetical protein
LRIAYGLSATIWNKACSDRRLFVFNAIAIQDLGGIRYAPTDQLRAVVIQRLPADLGIPAYHQAFALGIVLNA